MQRTINLPFIAQSSAETMALLCSEIASLETVWWPGRVEAWARAAHAMVDWIACEIEGYTPPPRHGDSMKRMASQIAYRLRFGSE